MSRDFYMVPICVETTGVWGPSGYKFIKELGRLTSEKTKEKRSTSCKRSQWRSNVEIVQASFVQ
jgi:hypothetical protein